MENGNEITFLKTFFSLSEGTSDLKTVSEILWSNQNWLSLAFYPDQTPSSLFPACYDLVFLTTFCNLSVLWVLWEREREKMSIRYHDSSRYEEKLQRANEKQSTLLCGDIKQFLKAVLLFFSFFIYIYLCTILYFMKTIISCFSYF